LNKEMSAISSEVWQTWYRDPRQRKGPTMTRDEAEDIPRSQAWLDTHLGIMRSTGEVAAWCHAAPSLRMEYAVLADAYSVIDAVRWLTMSDDFIVVIKSSNPRAKNSPYSHTQKMGMVITQTASHRSTRAAMSILPQPPSELIHYYGVGRGYGLGTPSSAATGMRYEMHAARREAAEIESKWQREKIERRLAALKG